MDCLFITKQLYSLPNGRLCLVSKGLSVPYKKNDLQQFFLCLFHVS